MAKSFDEWLKEVKKQNEALLNEKINVNNQKIEQEIVTAKNEYNDRMLQTEKDYGELYDLNEIQNIINKKQLEQRMADVGLGKSGLNATQNTALQLSYANTKLKFNQKEQAAIGSLKNQLSQFVLDAQNRKKENELKLRSEFEEDANKQAKELYKLQLDAENKKTSGKSSSNGGKTNKDEVIKTFKNSFKDINKNYEGVYSSKNLSALFNELEAARQKYGFTEFDCISILASGGIDYDEFLKWKSKNDKFSFPQGNESKKFIAGKNYDPIWFDSDYYKKRFKGVK